MTGPADEGGVFESFLLEQHSPTLRLTSDRDKVSQSLREPITLRPFVSRAIGVNVRAEPPSAMRTVSAHPPLTHSTTS